MSVDKRVRDWLMWKVWFPLTLIVLTWPAGCALHHTDAFQRAFAHGELLVFGGLILMEAAIELRYIGGGDSNDFWSQVAWFAAIVFLVSYGIVHMLAARTEDYPQFKHDLLYYAYFSCSVAATAVSACVFSYWRVKAMVAVRQLPPS